MGLFSRLAKAVGRAAQTIVDGVNALVGADAPPPPKAAGPLPTILDEEAAKPAPPTPQEVYAAAAERIAQEERKEERQRLAAQIGPVNPQDTRTPSEVEREQWAHYFREFREQIPADFLAMVEDPDTDMETEVFSVADMTIRYIGADGEWITKSMTRTRQETVSVLCRGLKYFISEQDAVVEHITLNDVDPRALELRTRRMKRAAEKVAEVTTKPARRKSGRRVTRPRLPSETDEDKRRRLGRERAARFRAKNKPPKKPPPKKGK